MKTTETFLNDYMVQEPNIKQYLYVYEFLKSQKVYTAWEELYVKKSTKLLTQQVNILANTIPVIAHINKASLTQPKLKAVALKLRWHCKITVINREQLTEYLVKTYLVNLQSFTKAGLLNFLLNLDSLDIDKFVESTKILGLISLNLYPESKSLNDLIVTIQNIIKQC